jgi:Cys-rich four helix bundle protein (predicted Tat secretion target)
MSSNTPNDARRQLLIGTAAVAATLTANTAFASNTHHHHHSISSEEKNVIEAALDCVEKGNACTAHCLHLIKMGDTTMGDCIAAVTDMLPMCSTLGKLAANQSRHLKDFASVCIAVCEDCEKACEEHADKHEECKNCMESCAACIKACKKLVA